MCLLVILWLQLSLCSTKSHCTASQTSLQLLCGHRSNVDTDKINRRCLLNSDNALLLSVFNSNINTD